MKVIDDDDGDGDDFDDDERKKSKKTNFSSNDRSGHDDQNAYTVLNHQKRSYPRGVNVRSKFGVFFKIRPKIAQKASVYFKKYNFHRP